jgi:hypothetical protein
MHLLHRGAADDEQADYHRIVFVFAGLYAPSERGSCSPEGGCSVG